MIRAEINKWIATAYPHRMEDPKKQLLLSRIAVGLNFANKRNLAADLPLSNKKKFFALLYAATAAKRLFDYCHLTVPADGPVVNPEGEIPQPSGNEWRQVWDACDGFEARRAAYVLIVGPEAAKLPEHTLSILGRLPWSLIIDFDRAATKGKALHNVSRTLQKNRSFHTIYPHQSVTINFASGTCWLFANADATGTEPEPLSVARWRQQTLPRLRDLARLLHRETAPRPVYLVVLGQSIDHVQLRNTFTAIEEKMGDAFDTIVVSLDENDGTHEALVQENAVIQNVICDWRDLALGLHQVLGEGKEGPSYWIPIRDTESKTVSREPVNPVDLALYSGTVEIVPASGSDYGNDTADDEIADFLRGNTITWRELDLHRDVDRDINRGPSGVIQRLRELLNASPNESFAIEHSAGAGGTTVARRIAWELRDEFPCVIVNTYNDDTVDVIDALFRRSNLPILIIADGSIPGTQRDYFFNELKERSIRFIILDVRRRHQPRDTASSAALGDPMTIDEAGRFLAQYEAKAPRDRRPAVRRLASNNELAPYRSAFFFGLYTFEREFVRVEDFVNDMLSELAPQAHDVIARLALITRYSQERLPVEAFMMFLGLDVRRKRFSAANLLGVAAAKLVMFDGKRVGIAHPLLAEEILRRRLSTGNAEPQGVAEEIFSRSSWRMNLTAFCIEFIEGMGDSLLRESAAILEILTDLFVERDIWQGSTDPKLFSALLNVLPTPESQRRVLESLCEHFPANAHFWGHLGRQINLRSTGSFEEAERALKRAVDLEPDNDVHHHGLGMVYRLEVRRRMQEHLVGNEMVQDRLEQTKAIFEQAEACFEAARKMSQDSQYPLVTPIQMIVETFERLAALSRNSDYAAFLGQPDYVSEWCREKIATAETLLAQLRQQEANSEPTRYRRECDSRIQGIIGNFGAMVEGLSSLLHMPGIAKSPVRRMLANAYVRRMGVDAVTVQVKTLRRIVELMQENLANDPTSGHDMRNWFRAFRMLPEFTLVEAIEKMTQWSLMSDSVDALYYLYILHFMSARRGIHRSVIEAKRYVELCKQSAPLLLSKKSFEWWAADNLSRPCRLVHHSELGSWSKERNFFEGVNKLGLVEGRIDEIRSAQAGTIVVDGMPAFFVPRSDFQRVRDLNLSVRCYVGFSYEGLRAWDVQPAATVSQAVEN